MMRKNRCTGSLSIESKLTPFLLLPKKTFISFKPFTLPWGMATPWPMPVVPSFSLSSKACKTASLSSAVSKDAMSVTISARSSCFSRASRSVMMWSSLRTSASLIGFTYTGGGAEGPGRPGPLKTKNEQSTAGLSLPGRLDEPVVAVLEPVDDASRAGCLVRKDEEVLVYYVHLHGRFLDGHGLYELVLLLYYLLSLDSRAALAFGPRIPYGGRLAVMGLV